ncbi:MAG: DUF1598 domain-containing protein [Pirellulales bacterium]
MRTALSLLRIEFCWPMVRYLRFGSLLAAALCCKQLAAQPPNNPPNALIAPGGQQNAGLFGGPNATGTTAQQGGAANADFDSLIDLITSTIQPEMWADNGGTGDIRPFFGGVLVDAAGTLQLRSRAAAQSDLAAKRGEVPLELPRQSVEARQASALRYVSLPRLEREIARRQVSREPLEPAMLTLAGLERVRYVFVYPESGDLVLAGPAGDWQIDPEGRIVASDTGQPVVRLDDLIVLLRRGEQAAESFFGCSINPRQEALATTQTFLASSSQRPLEPGQRKKWLGKLRDNVGRQDIEIFGVDPASRVASVLVEADYHMKLIGMGLADGVDGVESYLDLIKLSAKRAGASSPPPMSVLRWWFTLSYESILASPAGDAFELVGQGVRVLSENELLAEQGRRVHTGQSDPLNRQFAESFTAHFTELAAKYPVYGELRNVFDLAMAVALIHSENLAERAGWTPALLADGERLRLPQAAIPRQVETVINHRVINRRHIVAGVSGGVMVAPGDVLRESGIIDRERLKSERHARPRPELAAEAWWWDATEQ